MLGWFFLVWVALGARARCTILHCCFLGRLFFLFGGVGGVGFGEGGSGGANNVLGWPSYKIFSWTCCYAIHSSLALYLATRYQPLFVTCKTLLIFALLFHGGCFFWGGWGFWGRVSGGLITFLAGRLTRYSLGLAATLSTLLLHCTLPHAINFFL